MPVQNFVGWTATGALFMAVSRAVWRTDPDPARIPASFPLAMYAINMGFAVALSASVGLWIPVALALLLGLLPALLALAPPGWWTRHTRPERAPGPGFAEQRNADAY
jgi:putative membrane protein